MFKSILVAIATAALVSAQSIVSITSPLGNNVYTAGGQAIITWINPTIETIPQIQLSKGPSTLLQPVMTVATNVAAKDMQYTWNIPTTVAPGSDYAFVFGISPNLAYTGQFTINAPSGASASSSASANSTSAASSSAASSTAASSSAPVSSSVPVSSPAAASSSKPAASSSVASSSSSAAAKPTSAGNKAAPVISAVAVAAAIAIAAM